MFPCFDQPDIKATFTLRAQVPEDWTVISNEAYIEDEHQVKELTESLSHSFSVFADHA